MDVLRIPVARKFLQNDLLFRNPLDEAERPGADGLQPEIRALRLRRLRREDDPGAVGKLRQKRRIRCLQYQLDGQRIDHLDRLDVVDLAAPQAARHRQVTIQRIFHRIRIELLAILKQHARPQMENEMGRIFIGVAGRELRHDVQAGIKVEQLVAHAGEHDAPDDSCRSASGRECRVLLQADMQNLRWIGESGGGNRDGSRKS